MRGAIASLGLALPPKRITVNLSPADLPKEGSHYDLPIALAVLGAMGIVDAETLSGYVVVGELGLNGRVAPSPGVLLAAIHASGAGQGLICPEPQGPEAAWAGEVEVIAAPDLLSLLNHFKGSALLPPPVAGEVEARDHGPDLAQVKGQETAKRAVEISAAGGHNLLISDTATPSWQKVPKQRPNATFPRPFLPATAPAANAIAPLGAGGQPLSELLAFCAIVHHQQPTAHSFLDGVQRVARYSLHDLREQCLGVTYKEILYVRALVKLGLQRFDLASQHGTFELDRAPVVGNPAVHCRE